MNNSPRVEPEVNQVNQCLKFIENAGVIFQNELGLGPLENINHKMYEAFKDRLFTVSKNKNYFDAAILVRDMCATIYLMNNNPDLIGNDGSNSYMYQRMIDNMNYRDNDLSSIGGEFIPLMQDALKAIESKGQEPLATDILDAVDYFRELAERIRKGMGL